jgi:pentatricopeptide repeat protein
VNRWALVGSIALAILLVGFVFPRARAHLIGLKVRRIERLSMGGRLDDARAVLAKWEPRVRARHDRLRILIASLWTEVGDHDRAMRVLERVEILPIAGSTLVRRAVDGAMYAALCSAERVGDADRLLVEASGRDPSAPWIVAARLRQAREANDADTVRSALDQARRIVAIDPSHLHVARELYLTVALMGRFEEASEIAERMLPDGSRIAWLAPWRFLGLARWLTQLGWARLSSGDDAGAEEAFARAIRIAPDRPAIERLVATARASGWFNARRYGDAERALAAILATAPDPVHLRLLGECHRRAGRFEEAFALLGRAREAGVEPTEADLLEARLLADVGRGAEAEAVALRGAGGEDAFDPDALFSLAYVRVSTGSPEANASVRRWSTRYPWLAEREELLDRRAPDGRTWREVVELPHGRTRIVDWPRAPSEP